MPDSSTTETEARHRLTRPLGLAWQAVTTTALAFGVGLAAIMLVPALLGYERYVITGDSMNGTFDRGALVFEEVVPVSDLSEGDVITYEPPAGKAAEGLVTHRIVDVGSDRHGRPVFRTQGDANGTPDPWRFTLAEPRQARAVFHVPYVGYAFSALALREVRMLVIGVPALLIALGLLAGLWRQAGTEARRGLEPAASMAGTGSGAPEPGAP
jgi:signal peptidase